MLVDLPAGWEARRDAISAALSGGVAPRRVAQGVYVTHHNFPNELRPILKSDYPFSFQTAHPRHGLTPEEYNKAMEEWDWCDPTRPDGYGVCDRWEQIVERWPVLVTSPRKLLISLTEVWREDEPPRGGWRWHKWGEYIGDHEPKHEYLYDEDPSIESVLCFHVLELR